MKKHPEGNDDDLSLIDEAVARKQYLKVGPPVRTTPRGRAALPLAAIQEKVAKLAELTSQALCAMKNGTGTDAPLVVDGQEVLLVFTNAQGELFPKDLLKTVLQQFGICANSLQKEQEAVLAGKTYEPNQTAQNAEDLFGVAVKAFSNLDCEVRMPDGTKLSECIPAVHKQAFKPLVLPAKKLLPLSGCLRSHDSLNLVAHLEVTVGERQDTIVKVDWHDDAKFTAALKRAYCSEAEVTIYVEHKRNVLRRGGKCETFRAQSLATNKEQVDCAKPKGDLVTQAETASKKAA